MYSGSNELIFENVSKTSLDNLELWIEQKTGIKYAICRMGILSKSSFTLLVLPQSAEIAEKIMKECNQKMFLDSRMQIKTLQEYMSEGNQMKEIEKIEKCFE